MAMVEHLVVLIHGTFASDATWIDEHGSLANKLRQALPNCEVLNFRWSGNNSHRARIEAGVQLAAYLDLIHYNYQPKSLHLVAHSHGGNVAMYAIPQLRFDNPTTVSFLGTPFLNVYRRSIDTHSNWYAYTPAITIAVATAMLLFLLSIILVTWMIHSIVLEEMGLFILALGSFWVGGVVFEKVHLICQKFLGNRWSDIQDRLVQQFDITEIDYRVFIATVPGDEAGALLAMTDRFASAPAALMSFIRIQILPPMGFGIVIGFFIGRLVNIFFEETSKSLFYASVNLTIVALMITVAVSIFNPLSTLLLSIVRGLPVTYGGESPVFNAVLRVTSSTLPKCGLPSRSTVREYIPQAGTRGWKHCGFYEDMVVVDDMIQWIMNAPESQNTPQSHPIRWVGSWALFITMTITGIAIVFLYWYYAWRQLLQIS